MRLAIVTLALLLVATVIGCRDDSSMNPLTSQEPTVSALARPAPASEIILPLEGTLRDPDPRCGSTNIRGQVVARLEGNGRLCDLTLTIDAELWGASSDEPWKVAGSTCDRIKLNEWTKTSICKDYRINGRPSNVQLCVDFTIIWKPGIDFRRIYLAGVEIELVRPIRVPDPNNW